MAEQLDTIHIRELRVPCRIGTTEAERSRRQEVLVSLTLHADLRAACASDELSDTVDYGTLAARVISLVESSSFHLLERLAAAVAALCLEDPRVHRVEVEVDKPRAVPLAARAGVRIVRARPASPPPDPRSRGRLA
jgi:FolB domain-containing protein